MAFQPDDADRFFGRDAVVTELMQRTQQRRFLGVFGPSGCGKSSVLRAGLIAQLTATSASGNRKYPVVVVFTPGRHPLEECAIQLAGLLTHSPAAPRTEFTANPENLHLRIRQAQADHPTQGDVVLVIDQFEETFTLCNEEDERTRFIDALVTAATAETGTSISPALKLIRLNYEFGHDHRRHPRIPNLLSGSLSPGA